MKTKLKFYGLLAFVFAGAGYLTYSTEKGSGKLASIVASVYASGVEVADEEMEAERKRATEPTNEYNQR